MTDDKLAACSHGEAKRIAKPHQSTLLRVSLWHASALSIFRK
jgi:hypothetical protein